MNYEFSSCFTHAAAPQTYPDMFVEYVATINPTYRYEEATTQLNATKHGVNDFLGWNVANRNLPQVSMSQTQNYALSCLSGILLLS